MVRRCYCLQKTRLKLQWTWLKTIKAEFFNPTQILQAYQYYMLTQMEVAIDSKEDYVEGFASIIGGANYPDLLERK